MNRYGLVKSSHLLEIECVRVMVQVQVGVYKALKVLYRGI